MSPIVPSNQETTKPPQFDKPTLPLAEAVEKEARAANARAHLKDRFRNEPTPHFVELADRLYDAAIEAAKRQVNRAENLLRQIEAEAEATRAKVRERWHEIQELERNLEDMSSEMLQSFGRYNGKEK